MTTTDAGEAGSGKSLADRFANFLEPVTSPRKVRSSFAALNCRFGPHGGSP
jgi:hypothetical protein